MDDGSLVTFVELGGAGAGVALSRLRARLAAAGTTSRLLLSRDQADLHLLVVDGDAPLDGADAGGARVWRFRDAPDAPGSAGDGREPSS